MIQRKHTLTPPPATSAAPAIRQAVERGRARLVFAGGLFLVAFTLVAWRLVDVAVVKGIGEIAHVERAPTVAKTNRGDIFDRNNVLLATNLTTSSLYADPAEIADPQAAARLLATVLPASLTGLDEAQLTARLAAKRRFVWLRRGLTPTQHHEINALGIPGLHFQHEERRLYPQGALTSHVVGYSGADAVGLGGVEKKLDDTLSRGEPVHLSLDISVQHILREEIARQIEAFDAIGGAGLVLDARTGEVVAMTSLPDFDPNAVGTASPDAHFNRATLGVYEMGSTFKIFNSALALDAGTATMQSGYDATKPLRVARFTIKDYHPEGRWLSVPEIFRYSSNIGSARMALDVGPEAQRAFMDRLGLLGPIAVELPERGRPTVPSPWRRISAMTIAFGHGIAISPLHLASGVATTINGGVRWPVTVLRRDEGETLVGKQIISEETSHNMRRLLRLVVDKGTGRKAAAKGYLVGGKTGTAEKISGGKYDRDALLSSFVAAFPINDPRYVVLAMIDEPKGNKASHGYATGGWVAAPAVSRIVARSAPFLGVQPVDEDAPEVRALLDIKPAPLKQQPGGGRKRLASF